MLNSRLKTTITYLFTKIRPNNSLLAVVEPNDGTIFMMPKGRCNLEIRGAF